MVLERFGPPVVRTTRNMASGSKSDLKVDNDKQELMSKIQKDNIGL